MKKILIVLFVFIACGCTATYKLDFTDDYLTENINVTSDRFGIPDDEIENSFSDDIFSIYPTSLYNEKITYDDNNIFSNYSYKFSVNKFSDSNVANSCFEYFNFTEDTDRYYLITNGDYRCFTYGADDSASLDNLTIEFTTNHDVLSNNADKIDGSKYIWYINRDNYQDKQILLELSKDANFNIINTIEESVSTSFVFIVSIVAFILIIGIIGIVLFIKNKKSNNL